jgi:pilus assembly protein CpaB
MDRRQRTLIVMGIAVLLASVASYAVFVAISRMPVREVEVASMHVAVAVENLPMGTRLAKEHIKMTPFPASNPMQGTFSSPEALLGRGLVQPVSVNEPLTETKLAPIEAGAGLPPLIVPGMRALSVRVNNVTGVAGFLLPTSRVDLLVTMAEAGGQMMTRAVVNNLQVLTADTRYDVEQGKEGNAMPSSVVTLLVTPDDAERITLAQSTGTITLVLRNPLDMAAVDTKGARIGSLLGAPAPAPVIKATGGVRRAVLPPPPVAVAAPPPVVETYKAGAKSTQIVDVKQPAAAGGGQ